jgi:DNA-binding NarL/FixJ family response regulator
VVASNREIADELVVAVDTVKGSLSRLFELFGIGAEVPQNQKRALLARRALHDGVVGADELGQ